MPAKSGRQQRFFGAALGRKRAGKSRKSDPKLSEEQLREFARKPKGSARKSRGSSHRRVRSA